MIRTLTIIVCLAAGICPAGIVARDQLMMYGEFVSDLAVFDEHVHKVNTGESVGSEFPWADSEHPEIDYDKPLFKELYHIGARFSGWWAIMTEMSSVADGSPMVLVLNVFLYHNLQDTRDILNFPSLSISRSAEIVQFDFHEQKLMDDLSHDFHVGYRIDNGLLQEDRWTKFLDGNVIGLSGTRAEKFLCRLYHAESFHIEITGGRGEYHDATFDLAGIQDAIAAVEVTCNNFFARFSETDPAGFNIR